MKVSIRIFRADQEIDSCMRYIEGHRKVLEAYGVTQVTSANIDWVYHPSTYIVLVESTEDGRVLGGGRIQIADGKIPLPIETAIDKLDPKIYDLVKAESEKYGTGEYCGLWNSREVAGYGIGSILLIRIGIAMMDKLNIGSLFAFASPVTLKLSLKVGYKVLREVGINGTFYYPKEDLLATALMLDDPHELTTAIPSERERILDLKKNPVQKTIESGPKGEIEVDYDLRIKTSTVLS